MLTTTDLCPLDVVKMPREGRVGVSRYIKRPNPKPHESPLVLFEIQWDHEVILQPNYYTKENFLKSVGRQHEKGLFSTYKFRCDICNKLEAATTHFSACLGTPSTEYLFAQLVDTVAAVCIKAGICQWSVDKRLMDLAASEEETGDKETIILDDNQYDIPTTPGEKDFHDKLDGWLDSMQAGDDTPIETPAASAGHKKRECGGDDKEVIILEDDQCDIPTPPVDDDLDILNNWLAGNDILIKRPAASAGHKKRKSEFDGEDDEEGIAYQQNRRTEIEATHGQRSTSHLGYTPFIWE